MDKTLNTCKENDNSINHEIKNIKKENYEKQKLKNETSINKGKENNNEINLKKLKKEKNKKLIKSMSQEKIDIDKNFSTLVSTTKNKNQNGTIAYVNTNKSDKNKDYQMKKRYSQENMSYINRFINYEKQKEEKISEMKKEIDDKEKTKIKKKPNISRKSVELVSRLNLKDSFLERMEEEEKKSKIKQEKLIEKIKNERAKKTEEIEKPLDFKIKKTTVDKKFNKIYQEMIKKEEIAKEKLNDFSNVVHEYEMRECSFQPNINRNEENCNDKKIRKRRLSSEQIIQRLYTDELKNKENKRENLEQKYKLTFKPTINEKSLELALKRKRNMENTEKESNINNKKEAIKENKKIKVGGKKIINKNSRIKNKASYKINSKEEDKENAQNNNI